MKQRIGIFILLFAVGAMAFTPQLAGQTDINDVHVVPRGHKSQNAASKDPGAGVTFRVSTDLVQIYGTVVNPENQRRVTILGKEHFSLYENGKKQVISNVTQDTTPVVVGIILDESGSMADKFGGKTAKAREAVPAFCNAGNSEDEYFIVEFHERPTIEPAEGFYNSCNEIKSHLVFAVPKGETALLDAIDLGIKRLSEVPKPKSRDLPEKRKILLIISDGGDNKSRYTPGAIKRVVEEADVQIYAIGIFNPQILFDRNAPMEERLGPDLLSYIAEATGGRLFSVVNPNDLPQIVEQVMEEISREYVLAYKPTERPHDSKFHNVKVKIHPPQGLPPLQGYFRKGYYAR